MKRYRWPGNIRELENLMRRLAALHPQEVVSEALIEAELSGRRRRSAVAPCGQPNAGAARTAIGEAARRFRLGRGASRPSSSAFGDGLPPPGLYHRVIREIEVPLISAALAATRGNQIKAAELLELNRNTLRKKVRDLDIRLMRAPR